jgi:hypothetical protein
VSLQAVSLKSCGHSFCEACLEQWLPKPCPTCRKKPTVGLSRGCARKALFAPAFVVRDVVGDLRVRCRFGLRALDGGDDNAAAGGGDEAWVADVDGCPDTLALADVAAHEAVCAFELLTCGNVEREGAPPCGALFRRHGADAHAASCALRPVQCALGCGELLLRGDVAHHGHACAEAEVTCAYYGCNARIKRREVDEHNTARWADHLRSESRARAALTAAACLAHQPDAVAVAMASLSAAGSADETACAAARLVPLLQARDVDDDTMKGVCAALLPVMQTHPSHADVQRMGCTLLWEVAKSYGHVLAVDDLNHAVEAVAAAMGAHASCETVQDAACAALAELCRRFARSRADPPASHVAAFDSAVAALKVFGLRSACTALTELLSRHSFLEHGGAAQAAAVMMGARASDGDALAAACFLLNKCLSFGKLDKAHLHSISATVIRALYEHPLHAALQLWGCEMLARYAVQVHTRPKSAGADGAIAVLLGAVRRHCVDTDTLSSALNALYNWVADDDNEVLAVSLNARRHVAEAMELHTAHTCVQRNGCDALRNLFYSRVDATWGAQDDICVDVTVAALRQHAADPGMCLVAVKALTNIVTIDVAVTNCEPAVRAAVVAGAVPAVLAALNAGAQHEPATTAALKRSSCELLGVLCDAGHDTPAAA